MLGFLGHEKNIFSNNEIHSKTNGTHGLVIKIIAERFKFSSDRDKPRNYIQCLHVKRGNSL